MKLNFVKMQAQGNDYIYFDMLEKSDLDYDWSELSKNLSRRRFSIGADGIVVISRDEKCDANMRIFNADGSEGKMCGSALRCVTWILSNKKPEQKSFQVKTLSGIKTGVIKPDFPNNIEVNMGEAKLVEFSKNDLIKSLQVDLVDIGNRHLVVYNPTFDFYKHAPILCEFYKANIHFVDVISDKKIEIKIWEIGSGETYACGTGASSVAYSAMKRGLVKSKVNIIQPGGGVVVRYNVVENKIFLSGSVGFSFSGKVDI